MSDVIANTAAAALPASILGLTWNSVLLGLLNLMGGGALVAWVTTRPKNKEIDAKTRRDDLDDFRRRIDELEKKVDLANTHAQAADQRTHIVQMQMVSLNAAFQLVASELQRSDPDNQTLKQARELVAQAATGDNGMDASIVKLSRVSGLRNEL